MIPLHEEVLEVARALIRFDTSNAPEAALGRPPGDETGPATYLRDLLTGAGVDCELVARDPRRANLVARIPGSDPSAPSLAFVGHLDVVPADPRDWTHPPFAAVVDEGGWLWGRGAVDMKNEVAARAVAMAELARSGFRPRGDLWLIAVADEEDGTADVGMRWLLEARPDIRPDLALNEGGGERLPLSDGRVVQSVSIGEKGTYPARVVAVGEAGHGSTPHAGDNAVPLLGELLRRVGRGMPLHTPSPLVDRTIEALLGEPVTDFAAALSRAVGLHPVLADILPALAGTTMAPTMLTGSTKRNVMPARASSSSTAGSSRAPPRPMSSARCGPGSAPTSPTSWSGRRRSSPAALGPRLGADGRDRPACWPPRATRPRCCRCCAPASRTRSTSARRARRRRTASARSGRPPPRSSAAGFHNADERVHIDDLLLSVEFHVALARDLLGPG